MLISHVITRLVVGGAQENTLSTVMGLLKDRQYEVELISGFISPDEPEGSLEEYLNDHPQILHQMPELVRPISPILDLKALLKLYQHFKKKRPHIVHTHSGKAGILGRLAAKKAGVPHIIHSIHGPSFGAFQGAFSNAIFRSAERFAGQITDRFIGVSEAMCKQYLNAGIGCHKQYHKVYSGFDLNAFLKAKDDLGLRMHFGIEEDDLVIGKVGRLFHLKGHEMLLRMAPQLFEKIPKAKIILVGGGKWKSRFECLVAKLGISSKVIFTGRVSPKEVPHLIGIMDVVVHLSQREGLPRVLPQALAAGKPIVALDYDGTNEVCKNGRNGFLIPVDNAGLWVDRTIELAQDPDLRDKMGREGRQFVKDEFAEEKMIQDIFKIYNSLS